MKYKMYTSRQQLQSEEYLALSPSGSAPALETSDGVITHSEAICRYLAGTKAYLNLGGQSTFDRAQVDMWMSTMRGQLAGVLEVRRVQTGCGAWTQEQFHKSKNALLTNLQRFEEHLALRTYFVGHSVTLADIMFACILSANRTCVLDKNDLKGLTNVQRHLTSIMGSSFWTAVMGRSFCPSEKKFGTPNADVCKQFGVENCPHAGKGGNTGAKPQGKQEGGKKGGKQDNQPKGGKKGETKKKEEEAPAPKVVKELTPEEIKENEAAMVANQWFNDWKTFFANSKDKTDACDRLFKEIDTERFSVWHVKYDKLPTELKDETRSANMLTFFFRGFEGFNKDACAVHGLYGTEPELNLKGVWLIRGKEIPDKITLQSNFEYYFWTRMDVVSNLDDQCRLKHYWTNTEEDVSVVEGEMGRRIKIFK